MDIDIDTNVNIDMDQNKKLPELLAPAGSPEAARAAINAGADAIYLGMTTFSARAYAKNFGRDELLSTLADAHGAGVRVYVTINTAILDRELSQAIELVDFLYGAGVDALIVSDLGFASAVSARYPDLPLHASTQCSGHNSDAAEFLAEHGFSLMVCAREVDRENMKTLVQNSPIPIEVFVHGALCVSASGQCLMSSMIGGRSGNRGECAQPCRMPYNGRYPLSLKDNCLAAHITELIEMGVASLKLEGRMKSPDYVSAVVSVYRRLLDEGRNATDREIEYLAKVFSRDGFTDGYFTGDHKDMNGVRTDKDKEATAGTCPLYPPKMPTRAPIEKYDRSQSVCEHPFHLQKSRHFADHPLKSARFYDPDTIPNDHEFDIVYLPLDRFQSGRANGVILPPVIFDDEAEGVAKKLARAVEGGAKHALVGNVGHIELARSVGLHIHGDFRLNITNSLTAELFDRIFDDFILSPELTLPQIRDIGGEKNVIIYGRFPLMLLEKTCKTATLVDRRRVSFPVISEGGREIVLNSVPLYMADRADELKKAGTFGRHFIFTTEGPQEVKYTLVNYKNGLPTKKEVRRLK